MGTKKISLNSCNFSEVFVGRINPLKKLFGLQFRSWLFNNLMCLEIRFLDPHCMRDLVRFSEVRLNPLSSKVYRQNLCWLSGLMSQSKYN